MPKFPAPTLTELVVDTNKDWQGYPISNIGAPTLPTGALTRGLPNIYYFDYGRRWTNLGAMAGASINAMAYLGKGVVIIGDGNGYVYRSIDYGLTWVNQGAMIPGPNNYVCFILSLGDGIVILMDGNDHIWRSTDGGATWTDQGVITAWEVWGAAYLGNGIAILGDGNYHVWRSTDWGATWADLGAITTDWITAMACLGNGVALLADDDDHIWRSIDDGATWGDLGVITTDRILAITYLGNGVALVSDADRHIWRSIDDGATWADLGVITGGAGAPVLTMLDGIIIAADTVSHVWRSVDYGVTWTDLGAVLPAGADVGAYLGTGIAIIACGSNICRSTSAIEKEKLFAFEPANLLYPKFVYVKNTSGAGRAAGDVARHKAVAAGNEFDVPTANGEDSVLGMVTETIANNGWGYVQLLGWTPYLKSTNAGGNIVIGDYLCTEIGVRARLAGAGDMAFARALEACAAANCTIDALLIKPMKI